MYTQHNSANLLAQLLTRKPPHPEETFPVLPISSSSFGMVGTDFRDLVDSLLTLATQSNRKDVQKDHRKALSYLAYSLIHCIFRWEAVTLPTSAKAYEEDGNHYASIGFTRRIADRCIKALGGEDDDLDNPDFGYMYRLRKGFRGVNGVSKASCYFPTAKFIREFTHMLYTDFGGWDDLTDEYLYRFNKFEGAEPALSSFKDQIAILRNYNNFMREQSWAMKNPSYRSFSGSLERGGRIFNYYQNIANRRYKLRTKTLLNESAIIECDFNANHLWMFSYLCGEELTGDAYEPIIKESGCERDKVKMALTKLLGCTSKSQKGMAIYNAPKGKVPMECDEFKAIEAGALRVYPWLDTYNAFYNDTGAKMQTLEGEVSLRMMEWATVNEIPMLIVHDAYGVNPQHSDETSSHMLQCRQALLNMQFDINTSCVSF